MAQDNELNKPRGIYLLPNIFTTGGLMAGFYAIVAAMDGHYEAAAIAIFVAMLIDGFDGRVARMTKTESAFGGEYDSLADMVSFGVAPALVIFSWSLHHLEKLGWVAAFMYVATAALRLARFNTQIGVQDKRYFQGLASPAAAAVIASAVWFATSMGISGGSVPLVASVLTIVVALLMVSNARYHSFKTIDLKGKIPFVALFIVVLIFIFISIDPPQVLFFISLFYAASGVGFTLWDIRQARLKQKNRRRSGEE